MEISRNKKKHLFKKERKKKDIEHAPFFFYSKLHWGKQTLYLLWPNCLLEIKKKNG